MSELKVSEMVLGEDCLLRSMLLIIGLVPTDRMLNPSQMIFLMTSYKKSRKRRCREPSQTTAMMATPWTSTWPWLVIYTCVNYGDMTYTAFSLNFAFPLFITPQELKAVLLGSGLKSFPLEWKSQAFTFSEMHDLRYGIVQKKVLLMSQLCSNTSSL